MRESPAFDIINMLLREGCSIRAYDPAASERAKEILPPSAKMEYVDDPYVAAQDADALLILSDWSDFGQLDLAKLHFTLRYPIVVDGRNLYDPEEMTKEGFTYISVGRPTGTVVREGVTAQSARKRIV